MNPAAGMTVPTACVIGWPVAHSRSPVIHRFWLKELGISGDYVAVAVEPDKTRAYFATFPESGYVGCNVTVPHKEAACAAVAKMGPAASAIGAVNTIWFEDGRMIGDNTDGTGFLANLDQQAPLWDRDRRVAVVLGAGGSARAVVWALVQREFAAVHVVNRGVGRAEALAAALGATVHPSGWQSLPKLLPGTDIVVNTTTLGMKDQPPLEIDLRPLRPAAIVTDIVYVPLETPLLSAARRRGLRTVDGLGMLLHQAVPGFEKWFGRRPTVTQALRDTVLAAMG
jgi:shikimate dehydrogenase